MTARGWWRVSVSTHGAAVLSSSAGGGICGNDKQLGPLAATLFIAAAALLAASIYAHWRRRLVEFPELPFSRRPRPQNWVRRS